MSNRTSEVLIHPAEVARALRQEPAAAPPTLPYGWVIVATVALILTATNGARFLFGVVLKPVTEQFGWDRASLSLAITFSMIALLISQPVLGIVVDRFGPKRTLVVGTLVLGLSLLPLSFASKLWHFYVVYGILVALGMAAATTPVIATTLISRWFTRRRGAALALATSGSAFGQLMIVPAAAWTLELTDWRTIYRLLALLLIVVMVPVGLILLRDRPPVVTVVGGASRSIGLPDVISLSLQPALRTFAFWQLAFGFLVCGFTMAFPNTHFLAYADDMGMGHQQASFAVSVTAGFSILGSLGLGLVADRHRRASVLGLTYLLRGFAFLLLLLLPAGDLLYIYALVLGISWTATTPLTAAIATELYGPRHLGVIFGTMFMFMNLGFGVGAFLDGLIFELTGGYQFALAASAVLGFGAAIATWAVVERRPDAVGQMAAVGELERVAAPAD